MYEKILRTGHIASGESREIEREDNGEKARSRKETKEAEGAEEEEEKEKEEEVGTPHEIKGARRS